MTDTEYKNILYCDLQRHYPPLDRWKLRYRYKYPILAWQRRLRFIEHCERSSPLLNPFQKLWLRLIKFIHLHDSIRLGFTIPLHTTGAGLSIAHWGTITIEGKARIGRNCRIHQGVTIGSKNGKVPRIGDDCFIGANASVIGDITIGNNVVIGANSLVNRSFGDNVTIAGVPAKSVTARLDVDNLKSE